MVSNNSNKTIPRQRKQKKKHRVFLTIISIFLAFGLIGCMLVGGYVLSIASELPEITIDDLMSAQTSFVFDETGTQIATLHGGENRITVDLNEIPQHLIDAVIASEDIRFYEHKGVDFRSVMRALVVDVVDTLKAGEVTFTQGASTITMQLVRNVIDAHEKTLPRKIKEALLALQFEKQYDKDEILYYYLNEIYIGPQVYGVQAASQYYFDKDVSDITLPEAALLVAIIRNPGYYSPYSNAEGALVVRNAVLSNMIKYDAETYGVSAETAMAEPIIVYESNEDVAQYDYPWFVDYVVSEAQDIMVELGMDENAVFSGGLRIYTTLDTSVQKTLETAFANDDNFPSSSTGDIVESGMIIIETQTGEIKGLVGGRSYVTRLGFNRATDLVRSPGSTIKPVVAYGPAVELGYGAGYVIDDAPVSYGSWSPNNDDHTYMGRITMRTAIMRSRNVCAVKILQLIGEQTGWEYGVKMGLPLVESDKNLSLTLGGLTYGVSPLDMAGAFATFGNGGVFTEPYSITKILNDDGDVIYSAVPEIEEVFSAATAYIMTDMLTSAVNGGTGTSARVSGWQTAGKTGTNGLPSAADDPDYAGKSGTKDAWFCGYTSALTAAVWMGYDNKTDEDGNLQYLSNVYGGSYPARLFRTVMTDALQNYQDTGFSRPDGVSSMTVDTKTGLSPTELTPSEFVSSELFRSGSTLYGGDVSWTEVKICAESQQTAGPYCRNTTNSVRLVREDGTMPSNKVDDYQLYAVASDIANAATCTLHTSYIPGINDDWNWENIFNGNGTGEGTPPVAPTNLVAYEASYAIHISWNTAGNGSDIVYIVERTDLSSGDVAHFIASGSSYTDNGVLDDVEYSYRIYAYNSVTGQASSWSNTVTAEL